MLPVFRFQHQGELLMWLYLHPDKEFGVSGLAGRTGVALSTLHGEGVRLDKVGLIISRAAGRNRLIRANLDLTVAAHLTGLLEVTFGPRAARYGGELGEPP